MRIFKRLNLLDIIIIIAFFILVCAIIYNFVPNNKEQGYILEISMDNTEKIKTGTICTDFESGKQLGKVEKVLPNSFLVKIKGQKGEHGIRVRGKIYLENLPVSLYIGDFYGEGVIEAINRDNQKD